MKRFIEGQHRSQSILLPECLDDFVEPEIAGRPAYHTGVLLKIYIYGDINRIQSSRRLEREAQRNMELMWLVGRLAPDVKIIANFRKDNGKATMYPRTLFQPGCALWLMNRA